MIIKEKAFQKNTFHAKHAKFLPQRTQKQQQVVDALKDRCASSVSL